MSNLPNVGVHMLIGFVVELKLGKEVFVLISVLEIKIEEIHGSLDNDAILLK